MYYNDTCFFMDGDILKYIQNFIKLIPKSNRIYVFLIFNTFLTILIVGLLKKIVIFFFKKIFKDKRLYSVSRFLKIFLNITCILIILFIWDDYIKSMITLISFISAALTIAIRDLIFNFFCGLYIQIKKTFQIEDRIEIDGVIGDVMSINSMSFDIVEVNSKEENGQSTGKVVTFPNSFAFSKSIKNYTKDFKYIWSEITIKIKLDCNLPKNKKEIYKIVNNIDVVTNIPRKMKKQVNTANANGRVYFNKYDPIIYTKIVDDHIELTLRYLINPKKARFVESVI